VPQWDHRAWTLLTCCAMPAAAVRRFSAKLDTGAVADADRRPVAAHSTEP
jgi:hypothetical protein